MALAFASVPASNPQAPVVGGALRGAAAPAPQQSGAGLLAPLGATCAARGLAAAQRRSKRAPATQRHFFGGEPAPPPPPKSYKDFDDKWLAAADLGFDPANLAVGSGVFDTAATAVPQTTYYNYRESEVKHGRFAMVAFLAIFFEEADRGAVLSQLGVAGAVDKLDGTLGLDEVQAPVLAIGIGIQAGGRCDHVGTCWGNGDQQLGSAPCSLSLSLSLFLSLSVSLSLPRGCPLAWRGFRLPLRREAFSGGGARGRRRRLGCGAGGADFSPRKGMRACQGQSNLGPKSSVLGLSRARSPHPITPLRQALAEYNLQKEEDDGNVLSVEYNPDRCPGDLGFDPLKLQRNDQNKKYLHNVEVNVGRLAMIGVTSFLVREFAIKDL